VFNAEYGGYMFWLLLSVFVCCCSSFQVCEDWLFRVGSLESNCRRNFQDKMS